MPHREITDAAGVRWEVWEVHPTTGDKRRMKGTLPPPPHRERRRSKGQDFSSGGAMHAGWLAMMSKQERRRVFPVPDGWETLSDDALRALVAGAESTGKTRRLIE